MYNPASARLRNVYAECLSKTEKRAQTIRVAVVNLL